jgi:phospholipid/cholesterol/gamma-HCH transport system ATP-binding protein
LEQVGLAGLEARRTYELSTGMRRRVGFARAIALEPAVLLFDEPTAGLDPMMISLIHEVIHRLTVRTGTTSVMVRVGKSAA